MPLSVFYVLLDSQMTGTDSLLLWGKGCCMGSVPVQLLIVANTATHTTCDTIGDTLKAVCVTCENRASRDTYAYTHQKQATWAHASKVHGRKIPHQ